MRPSDLVRNIDEVCARLSLGYFITGSVASSYYGEYRTTLDVDAVINLPLSNAAAFCSQFPPPDWYVSLEAAQEAVGRGGMFNIIHAESGLKIDVCTPKIDEVSAMRLSRKQRVTLQDGVQAWFSSPEDVILSKLEFYRQGGSEKHIRDITSMLKIADRPFDLTYINEWALRVGVQSEWQAVKSRVGIA